MTRKLFESHVNHRAFLKDASHLRCLDCQVTLFISHSSASAGSTSTSSIPKRLKDPDACDLHPGEPAEHCGRCVSELREAEPTAWQPAGSDPSENPEWQQARDIFRRKAAERAASKPPEQPWTPSEGHRIAPALSDPQIAVQQESDPTSEQDA